MKDVSIGDRSAQASSVGNSIRKDNSDTKSTASRTTLTLDEKESLRPDDSASMQGGQDEEVVSPTEPVIPQFKINGDPDVRAFRDQLYEIDKHEGKPAQLAPRPMSRETLPIPQPHSVPIFSPDASRPETVDPSHGVIASSGPPPGLIVPPDEKLVEALNSPKDRLFVLKIEQDFIDFIVNSKELELQLPSTNTFYRLLSHKLAEYYFLGHVYEESLKAVRIRRLPHTRLAPALIGSEPKSQGATPPPAGSMKIMRRGVEDPKFPNFDSRPDSSSEHENGDRNNGDIVNDGQKRPVDKSQLSREERERQYAEVRARIFEGNPDSEEGSNGHGKEMSRSSSHSGNKKNKRGKRPKDDSFEARSSYTSINGQAYPNSSFMQAPGDMTYLNGFPTYPQYPALSGTYQANPPGYQVQAQDFAPQSAWPGNGPFSHPFPTHTHAGNFTQFNPGPFEPPAAYYQSQHMGSQSTPKPHQPELAAFPLPYQNQPDASGWTNNAFVGCYPQPGAYPGGPHVQAHMMPYGYDANAMHSHGYGMLVPPQFNPQSQTFVPNAHMVAMPGWQSQSSSGFTSPHFQHASPRKSNNQSHNGRGKNSNPNSTPQPQSNSLARWPAPSSLPAKPPPTSSTLSFQMPRHMEQGTPLPSRPLDTNGHT